MRCNEAQKWILWSLDRTLPPDRTKSLDDHVRRCPRCLKLGKDYGTILERLREEPAIEPLPNFWQHVEARIKERERLEPWTVWLKWSRRAIPVSLLLIGFFIGAIAFLSPALEDEMSQPEALLLRNVNPLAETNTLFNEEKIENKSMMIIFAGDERIPSRRYGP